MDLKFIIMTNYFITIPGFIRNDKELTSLEKLLYGEIAFLCENNGYCWASNAYFADIYGVDKLTISRAFKKLRNKKYIAFDGIDKKINGIDKKINGYRYICITPIDKKINLNNIKKNNKNKHKGECEKIPSYDIDAFEKMLNNK